MDGGSGKTDERFSSAKSDPRFKRVPRQVRKIEIDNRFAGMFQEERFQLTYPSDKRGRSVSKTSSEDLRRFYRLEGEGEKVSGAELVCRSRGEVEVESSSSDSDTDEEDTTFGSEGVSEELIHAWAELDQSAPTTDTSTSRLAVCNMDWDRVTANDILLLFSSLTPDKGHILSVRIFPSEYGRERIRVEDTEGPDLSWGEGGQDEAVQTERLRKYQLNRLLYYYAIVETDSTSTSDYLYELCNGTEYELSGTRLDIRVVPDEMEFEDTVPTSVATPDTLPRGYMPTSFQSSALQHTKVQLTWDETDPARQKVLNQNFSKSDIRELDFQAYLASGSESDEEISDGENEVESEERSIEKFRSLLTDLESKESEERKEDIDLEITWDPGKFTPLEEAISKKGGAGELELTPWEEYVKKRKEKKKLKRKKNRKQEDSSEEGNASKLESTFAELGGKKKKSKSLTVTESEQKEREELQLLMASDSETESREKRHFNMSEIWKYNQLSEKKKGKLAKKGKLKLEDDFKLDLNDSRFGRLLDSPIFAPDPSDPQFHQGRNLKGIIDERKRRRETELVGGISSRKQKVESQDKTLSREQLEMSALVRKLKRKSEISQSRKANKLKIH